jgi:phage gp29-like protein
MLCSFPGTSSCDRLENVHGEAAEELLTSEHGNTHRRMAKMVTQDPITKLFINCTLCIISMRIMTQVYFDVHFSSNAYITCIWFICSLTAT